MSSDRNRLSKPARPPLTPRVAGSATSTPQLRPSAPRLPTGSAVGAGPGTPMVSPRVASRPTDETPKGPALGTVNANITPRSAKRRSRVDSSTNSPLQEESPADIRPKTSTSTLGLPDAAYGRSSGGTGLGVSVGYGQNKPQARLSTPKSVVGGSTSTPLVRSPGYADLSSQQDSIESRFFHASDVHRSEHPSKRPEPKRGPAFFYADGKEDTARVPPTLLSPVMSAVPEKGSSVPWQRSESQLNWARNPPMSSPALSATGSSVSSFFPAQSQPTRAPSPSKENIHLSYRKGASQIFGTRPTQRQAPRPADLPLLEESRRTSIGAPQHHKSPSLSSIDSGNSHASRRRSSTAIDGQGPASPLTNAPMVASPAPRIGSPPQSLRTIDTSLASSLSPLLDNGPLSPNKKVSELAADARRERKVLDLEISNSSLLAINASLEREVRRQKMELKRFRRLSRAGRFSIAASELSNARSSGGSLSILSEDDEEDDNPFAAAMIAGLIDLDDEVSDSEEDDSLMGSNSALSPSAQQDRLARDEKRLRVDLEKHKELLVVSQNINQSLKRCMYATEAMIGEGRKALQYHVRVSDVKLGGRILSGLDDDEIEIEDEFDAVPSEEDAGDGDVEGMKGLLDVWAGVGRPQLDGSEGSGDRDSGIELEKHLYSGRPPGTSTSAHTIGNTAAAATQQRASRLPTLNS